ncbi:hypothetical protein [Flavobacterium sp. K5-23]|uniref:hypothetical protein n=1 Tax=Flavobacterium sp. K5-23 TaxID=2746225 RepID=UPI00200D0913|nr:hypothetical protein [Flavobacterium sp. K5-23]UQD57579.1 hypothetical protein FLAK523_14765 [Flavobacterium sp. K5-23]
MKTINTVIAIVFLGTVVSMNAQEAKVKSETRVNTNQDKIAYYEQRGAEDARFEMEFKAKTKAEEKAFWKEQKQYERDLKEDNNRAHRAYVQGKKDAYAEHHYHCDDHCYHSDSFYHHAGFYYYQYDQRNYQRSPRSTSVNTQIRVNTPSVRLGLF